MRMRPTAAGASAVIGATMVSADFNAFVLTLPVWIEGGINWLGELAKNRLGVGRYLRS